MRVRGEIGRRLVERDEVGRMDWELPEIDWGETQTQTQTEGDAAK